MPIQVAYGLELPRVRGSADDPRSLHGELAASINDNVFLLVGVPVLASWVLLRRRHGDLALPIPVMIAVAVAVIAWTVLRNLPGFPLVPTISG